MIASLPMYWRAETCDWWQALWHAVQQQTPLPDLTPPEALGQDWLAHWRAPDLALSMTCGLPLRAALRGQVTYVGTLDFGLGGPPGHYHSVLITRPDVDLTGPVRLAYNAPDSQSGWAAVAHGPALQITDHIATGAHAASLQAVATGVADVAYLDAVTMRVLDQVDPFSRGVIVAARTRPTPGLPLICARGRDPAPLRAALRAGLAAFRPAPGHVMGPAPRLVVLDEAAYHDQPVPAPPPLR